MRVSVRLALAVALVLVLGGCGGEAGDPGSTPSSSTPTTGAAQRTEDLSGMSGQEAERRLQQSRSRVRAAAEELVDASALALEGGLRGSARGRYAGCAENPSGSQVTAFQYVVDWRVDAGPGAERPYLDRLAKVLRQRGFEVQPPRGDDDKTTLHGRRGGVVAGFTEYPGQDFVLAGVSGPCLEPPEELRDRWLKREDPDPELG